MSVAITPNHLTFNDLSYIGPPAMKGTNRTKYYLYSENQAPAYVPSALLAGDLRKPVEQITYHRPISIELIKELKNDIKNHVEMRIQLFVLQLLLVYRSGLRHQKQSTDTQVGRGKGDYEAAHSSTLPSFSSYWKERQVVFAKDSSFYVLWNSTVLLPKVVNKIDSRIDRNYRTLGLPMPLREVALHLLNVASSSEGEFDPKAGLKSFLEWLYFIIEKGKATLSAITPGRAPQEERIAQELFILGYYSEVAGSYLSQLSKSDAIFKELCFVPSVPKINQDFFLDIQSDLYRRLISDFSFQPLIQEIIMTRATPLVSQGPVTRQAQPVTPAPSLPPLTGKAKTYQDICLASDRVRQLVGKYFAEVSPDIRESDKALLPQIKTSATLHKYPLSEQLKAIREAALDAIRLKERVQEPQKMGVILFRVLKDLELSS